MLLYNLSYHKIPKISPGGYIWQWPFWRGLVLEGLIFGGALLIFGVAYLWWEICNSRPIGLAL